MLCLTVVMRCWKCILVNIMHISEHNAQSTYYEFINFAILSLKMEEYIGHKCHISSWYILLVMNQNTVHKFCLHYVPYARLRI